MRLDVALIAVLSIDGCTTRHQEATVAGWSSPEDQAHLHGELNACDCAIFGAGTYRADGHHIRPRLRPSLLRVVMSRTPEVFARDVVAGQLEFTDRPPAELLADLTARGRRRCALLGGEQIYGQFLAADLVDELVLTVEPLVFGHGRRLLDTAVDVRFSLHDVTRLNASTLLLRYRRPRPPTGERRAGPTGE